MLLASFRTKYKKKGSESKRKIALMVGQDFAACIIPLLTLPSRNSPAIFWQAVTFSLGILQQ